MDRVAAQLAVVKGERARIGAEIARLEEDADRLAEKLAEWGMDRVEIAMKPIQRRLAELTQSCHWRQPSASTKINEWLHGTGL